ncbi:hypothetical protein Hamer_G031991, partial [Homarus americanus]
SSVYGISCPWVKCGPTLTGHLPPPSELNTVTTDPWTRYKPPIKSHSVLWLYKLPLAFITSPTSSERTDCHTIVELSPCSPGIIGSTTPISLLYVHPKFPPPL